MNARSVKLRLRDLASDAPASAVRPCKRALHPPGLSHSHHMRGQRSLPHAALAVSRSSTTKSPCFSARSRRAPVHTLLDRCPFLSYPHPSSLQQHHHHRLIGFETGRCRVHSTCAAVIRVHSHHFRRDAPACLHNRCSCMRGNCMRGASCSGSCEHARQARTRHHCAISASAAFRDPRSRDGDRPTRTMPRDSWAAQLRS